MPGDLSKFDEHREAEQSCQAVRERMIQSGFSDAEIDDNLNIMQAFAKIAGSNMIRQRGGIPIPGNAEQQIPYDLLMARQTMTLFTEGMYHAFIKCRELHIVGEIKHQFLQNLALEVFNQVDNLVAATLGQNDMVPEVQLSKDQQHSLLHQTVESVLLYYITEHESQYGPIHQPETLLQSEAFQSPTPSTLPQQASVADIATTVAKPAPVTPQAKPKGPTPHDKYAAVALLLETLPPRRQEKILAQFNTEEQALVQHYASVKNIEANLDLPCVEVQLKHFSKMLLAGSSGIRLKTKASEGMRKLAAVTTGKNLLTCVVKERPLIRKYLGDLVSEENEAADQAFMEDTDVAQMAEYLPGLSPRMEEVLYRYLSRQIQGPNNTMEAHSGNG